MLGSIHSSTNDRYVYRMQKHTKGGALSQWGKLNKRPVGASCAPPISQRTAALGRGCKDTSDIGKLFKTDEPTASDDDDDEEEDFYFSNPSP
ncbi:hypothetical protein XELAEV_18041248mg [Xenopus laevis]|nr:hypothetical protein XELAEV_18041248mg [Xenopus laevis]